jgi:translocator assembly and maintenance protein 41
MTSRAVISSIYQQVLSCFPRQHLRMAFAYGSGVFQQQGHKDMSKNMLDFVFVVDDPVDWHRNNMIQNYSHYSFLKLLGPEYITMFQNRVGARIYFNTLVPCEGRMIKYGVIQTDLLVNDLFDWETLYISGRLHKPIQVVHREIDDTSDLPVAMMTNLNNAVHTALLLLDETFTEEELYMTIAGLSYAGDFRMTVGEDKNKVQNIVRPNIEKFRELYSSILDNEDHLSWNKSSGTFEQSLHSPSQHHHLNLLPLMLQVGLVNYRSKDGRMHDTEEVLRSFAHDGEYREVIKKCISGIVKQSSLSQGAKGILTAGLRKSLRYSYDKLKKMWKGKKVK